MLIHYITGIVVLVAGGIHLWTVFLTAPVEENLRFDNTPFAVLNVYRNWILAGSLEILLLAVAFHGFNGLRVILLELHQGSAWTKAVNLVVSLVAVAVAVYGTRTILIAFQIT
jgi:succinate dehydrogenase / fumarate reductase membrane anchor subunit